MAAHSRSRIADSVAVEVNGEEVEVKGPDPDRLANHEAEVAAFDSTADIKGPAE
jgi:ribosomal protein L6P/L9E